MSSKGKGDKVEMVDDYEDNWDVSDRDSKPADKLIDHNPPQE